MCSECGRNKIKHTMDTTQHENNENGNGTDPFQLSKWKQDKDLSRALDEDPEVDGSSHAHSDRKGIYKRPVVW